MISHFLSRSLLVCFIVGLAGGLLVLAQDKDWRPITPEELSVKAPLVEPDADAEAIFWEIRIDDSSPEDLSLRHYVRVKIFTERGREKFSKLDVPFTKGIKIKDLSARVIRPDGTIVEINNDDIFEREIIKSNGVKIMARSLAMPNIEPGVIIEYRYKETIKSAGARGMHLEFQRDIPIQKIAYFYKPYNGRPPQYESYNFTDTKFEKDQKGFWLASRTNIPALKEEPKMPPDDMVRAWMLLTGSSLQILNNSGFSISYTIKNPTNPLLYWASVAGEEAPLAKFMNKENGDIKSAVAEITSGVTDPEEKLKKIYAYCQTQINNTTFDPSITDEQRSKLPQIKSVADVLKRKAASSQYVDMLFGALANASGFETRVAFTGDRSKMFFSQQMTNEKLIHPAAIAVKVGDNWKYCNPGLRFLPYGMLVWYEEGNAALLVGESKYNWDNTPLSGYEASSTKRTGKFTLAEDGTLDGDVRIELNGQPGLTYRLSGYDETPAKLEESLKQDIKRQISVAEVSNVFIENVSDNSKPVVEKYKIHIPNYAQKTGKRLFLQPSVFEYGKSPLFSSATRKYDIFFRYPWSEADNIEIALPAGFDLDNAEAPGALGDKQNISALNIRIRVDKTNNILIYNRNFHFGGGGNVLFRTGAYPVLKNLFDSFNKADAHTITLKHT